MKLSYVLTTRNKLPYLRLTLPELVRRRKSDEEIIVVHGAGTDGTEEYLRGLLKKGGIQKLVSEPDFGEAHGTNKGVLLAKGDLIKIITDDDLFSFPSVERCAEFMAAHPKIDLLLGNGGKASLPEKKISAFSYDAAFQKWMKEGAPFAFCGLGLLIRKSSLPLLGLFDASHIIMDAEYSLRASANKKTELALYTGALFFHVGNKNSNTNTMNVRFLAELKRLEKRYGIKDETPLLKKVAVKMRSARAKTPSETFADMSEGYAFYGKWLADEEANGDGQFLYRK